MREVLRRVLGFIFYVVFIGGGIALIVYEVGFKSSPDYLRAARLAGVLAVYIIALAGTRAKQEKYIKSSYEKDYADIIKDSFFDNKKAYKRLMKGIDCYNKDNYRGAIRIFERLRGECSSSNEYVAVRFFEGMCYLECECYEEAIAIFEDILQRNNIFTYGWVNLGNAYMELGNLNKAIEVIGRAIDLDPDDAVNYTNLAALYGRQGNPEMAVEYAKKAIACNGNQLEAISTAAVAYKMLGDWENVEKYRNMYSVCGGDLEEIAWDLEQVVSEQQKDRQE